MFRQKTINVIINAVKPFKIILEYLSCEKHDGQAFFKFRAGGKINSLKMLNYCDDIRMRLACRDKVKIEILSEDTFFIILSEDFAEETATQEKIIEPNTGNMRINEAIKSIKKEISEKQTVDVETFIGALKK